MRLSNILFPDFGHSAQPTAEPTHAEPLDPGPPSADDIEILLGAVVIGTCGEKIGTIAEVYVDNQTGCSDWAAVSIGRHRCLAPMTDARVSGTTIWVSATAEQVYAAPHRDPATALGLDDKHDLENHFEGTYDHHRCRTPTAAT